VIRPALNSDATEITALWNAMILETAVTFTTELKLRGDVEAMIADSARCVLIAELDGAFSGFALFGSFRNGPGYAGTVEHSVYVAPKAKRKGLGRLLLDELTKMAVKTGHHVMVGAISGGNLAAVKFHQSLGFDQVARMPEVGRKNSVWHDLILMQKILETP
jgi:L-amino acid N-acyltransferase YncA